MAMRLDFPNIMQFFAAISPILLIFFLVMISIFNSDIKGLVYLGGILIASLLNLFAMYSLNIRSPALIPASCNLFEFPFNLNEYIAPAFNSMFISFTLAYLLGPMISVSGINYPVLITILGLLVLDGVTKITGGCTTFSGVALGSLSGISLGFLYFLVLWGTGNEDLLFFNAEPSNNVICSRPKKQQFKCVVYKNGEVLKTL